MPTSAKPATRKAPARPAAKAAAAKPAAQPAARKAASAPRVHFKWYVADEVRQDPNGKITLVGLYPDNVILAHLPRGAKDPSPAAPLEIPGLSLLCVIVGLAGERTFSLVLDDSPVGEFGARGDGASSCNMVFRLPAIEVRSWGVNTVALKSTDGKLRGEMSFEIRRAPG